MIAPHHSQSTCDDELAAAQARLARWTAAAPHWTIRGRAAAADEACESRLAAVEAAAASARRQAGTRSCVKTRRGPTGGYCLRKGRPNKGGNSCLAPGLAAALARHAFVGSAVTVLDLGAGIGQYGTFFTSHPLARHVRYIGLDGAENIEESTGGLVRFADLTDGLPRDIRALPRVNWAMSLEVAEHVPRSGEPQFVHTLASIPTDGIILSWATPGQPGGGGGARHINCQWASYVDCAFGFLGFEYDAALVAKLGRHTPNSTFPCPWLRHNIMAFRKVNHAVHERRLDHRGNPLWLNATSEILRLRSLLGGPVASPEFERLYLNMTAVRCEHVDGPRACDCDRRRTGRRELICPTCSEQRGPREPRTGRSCVACDECAGLNRPSR